MNDTSSPYIVDATQESFASLVLQKSHEAPVLVDFWAAWCGPCRMLAPILTRLAQEYQGQFFLVKVDTDAEQALAAQYGIRSLPTVKVFKNGEVVEEFLGVQPERVIRTLIDRHSGQPPDPLLDRALEARRYGDVQGASALLQQALAERPEDDRVRLQLAQLLLEQMRVDASEDLLKGLSPAGQASAEARALRSRLEFGRIAAKAPPLETLERRIAADPKDSEARYQWSARQVMAGRFELAFEQLLEIVKRDRGFREDIGRKALLLLFNLLGPQDERVKRYRAQLATLLN